MVLVFFYASWQDQESSGFLICLREDRKTPVPGNGLKIFLTNCQENVDIHACSITEHVFLYSICNAQLCKVLPMHSSAIKFYIFSCKLISRNTSQWLFPVDVHGNQVKQETVFIIVYILKATSWNNNFFSFRMLFRKGKKVKNN